MGRLCHVRSYIPKSDWAHDLQNSRLWNVPLYSYIALQSISVIHVSMYKYVFFFNAFQWNIEISRWNQNRQFHCFKQWKYDFWIFNVLDYFFLLYFINSRLNVLAYSFNVVCLSEITATMLTFRNRTSDVTYCADVTYCTDVTLFLHTMSGGWYFFWTDFLHCIALNAIWANCLGAKLRYHQIVYPLNTLNKTKLTRTG